MHRVGPQVAKLLAQSLVAGAPINVQFMVKNSKKIHHDGRVGVRSIHQRQSRRRGSAQNVLFLSRARQRPAERRDSELLGGADARCTRGQYPELRECRCQYGGDCGFDFSSLS